MATATRAPKAKPKSRPEPLAYFPSYALDSIYRFTVDQYHRMIEAGILGENDPVELLAGWIVIKMARNPRHDSAICRSQMTLSSHLPESWIIRVQCAITAEDSEPEPDLAIVRGPLSRYDEAHPCAADIATLMEIANASILRDQRDKVRIYARARIPVYWIINLVDARVEVYTQPRNGKSASYQQRQDYGRDDAVPLVIEGREICTIPVKDLIP